MPDGGPWRTGRLGTQAEAQRTATLTAVIAAASNVLTHEQTQTLAAIRSAPRDLPLKYRAMAPDAAKSDALRDALGQTRSASATGEDLAPETTTFMAQADADPAASAAQSRLNANAAAVRAAWDQAVGRRHRSERGRPFVVFYAGLENARTTSRRIRLSIGVDLAPRLGGGMYRRLAGNAREWRESSVRPCRSATAATIAELRTNVPRTVESPTTYTARPPPFRTRDVSANEPPISHA